MKSFKRIISTVLTAAMITASASLISAAQVSFTDTAGHWAWDNGCIPYLVEKDVINGYPESNGTYTFRPDGTVTRAEFIKMLDETFGLTATTPINYSDISTSDWYYPFFAKAAAQGYILNYGSVASPNGKLTREEAISLLARYLDLPKDEKASPSTFSDYNSITSYYRDYVLMAISAGLINGYEESNGTYTFRPQNTLTRAEALTILYRAAGSIFTQNAYTKDNSAYEKNAVIKNGNVTLTNITLNGRTIVSEGASGGTVTFSGSRINDTLYIRGNSDVMLVSTTASNIVVDSDSNIKISIFDGSTIDSLTINSRCSVSLASGTNVKKLTVNSDANLTSVSGDGIISMAYINANNFTSAQVPTEFEIANGITAKFGTASFEGSSANQEAFSATPFVTTDSNNFYLNVLSLNDGVVRYYYTNSSYCPTISNFDSYYLSSTYRDSFNVTANRSISEKTYSTALVKSFGYVVLQLQSNGRAFTPVIIPNTDTSGTGFSTDPYLASESSVRFMASTTGTVYYMYAETGTQLNANDFLVAYNEQSKELKGETAATSIRAGTVSINSRYSEVNRYMVFMFKTATGLYYTPVVISIGDNGFSKEPAVTTPGTIDFTSKINGTLYYYYSSTKNLPSADKFNSEYRSAEYSDKLDVTKNKAASISYKTRYSDEYPYMIMCIRDSSSNYMQPVAVSINYDPGFIDLPEVINDSTIRFRTDYSGTVYYYYTKESKAPTSKEFDDAYASAGSRYKDKMDVSRNSYERITYNAQTAATYPYMAIMLTDDDGESYQPVVVSLRTTSNNGFTISPYVSGSNIYFKTIEDCEVWWFYSRTDESVASSEFYSEWDRARYGSSKSVKGGSLESFSYDKDKLEDYPYIVICTSSDDDSDDFSYPVVLKVAESEKEISGTGISVTRVTSDTIYINAYYDGMLYYYETDSSRTPSTSGFDSEYMSNSATRGSTRVYAGDSVEIDYSGRYDYVVFQLEGEDSRGRKIQYNVVSVDIDDRKTNYEDSDDGYVNSSTGIEVDYSRFVRERVLTVTAKYDGTIQAYAVMTTGAELPATSSITVTANEEAELTFSNIISSSIDGIRLQFTDSKGNKYQSVTIPVVPD